MEKKQFFQYKAFLKGFTLAEVLITLVIIGVVAAITVPTINTEVRKEQYKASLFKAIGTVNQATLKYRNIYGENPQCGYWKKNPYSSQGNSAQCVDRNENGTCSKWQMNDGSDLPADYNGFFGDCSDLWKSFYETMVTQKICKRNAYANGCIPKYKGRDNLYAGKNPDKSDYEVMAAVSSSGFTQAQILAGSAIILNDGMILFSYMTENARYFAVDVNGQKGPNKWGTDVHTIIPKMENATTPPVFYYNDSMLDSGSHTNKSLLYR